MTSEAKSWHVGIVGVSPVGLFLMERLCLNPTIRFVGAFDTSPSRREMLMGLGCPLWDQADAAISSECDAVLFSDGVSEDFLTAVLLTGKHIVIERPWLMSSDALRRIGVAATSAGRSATAASLRRWSAEFVAASAAKNSGPLGSLRSANLTSCEKSLPTEPSSQGVLREFGYHWLDQLLLLIPSRPRSVFARQSIDGETKCDHGFMASIEFDNGGTAQIEIQTRSRLGYRTGWMLEGTTGSYRSERLFTETVDGEIVDEPMPVSAMNGHPIVDELVSTWLGQSTRLPTLNDAADVVQLIEAIERSASVGERVSY